MKNSSIIRPTLNTISTVVLLMLAACTVDETSEVKEIDIGTNVLLRSYALLCQEPSKDLNLIARNAGKDLRDIYKKVSQQAGCYDASAFEKGQWKVLAKNDTQILIEMEGYSGEFWTSNTEVDPGTLPAIKTERTLSQSGLMAIP
jgi:hypothetical protein